MWSKIAHQRDESIVRTFRTCIRAILFLSLFVLLFLGIQWVMRPISVGGYSAKGELSTLYNLPKNSVDVLILGSSHEMRGINCPELYSEYGISALQLNGSTSHPKNYIFTLKEALKYQKPKLVIVSLYTYVQVNGHPDWDGSVYHNYIDLMPGFRYSMNRLEYEIGMEQEFRDIYGVGERGLKDGSVIIQDGKYVVKGFDWLNMTFDLLRFHSNWKTIDDTYFAPLVSREYMVLRNFVPRTVIIKESEGVTPKEYTVSTPYNELIGNDTFAEMKNYLDSNNINYLFIDMPTCYSYNETYSFKPNELNFLSLNTKQCANEMALDYAKDFSDGAHLNFDGSNKVTRYLGAWLEAHYHLPDRRGQAGYEFLAEDLKLYDKTFKLQFEQEMQNTLKNAGLN